LLDTNVLASGLATRGLCAEIIEAIINEHQLLTCEPVLNELRLILPRKFHLPAQVVSGFLGLLDSEGEVVSPTTLRDMNFEDPEDIPILACAVGGRTDVLVTGDKALQELGEIEGVVILSPRRFWQRLASLKEGDAPA
jgi:putative PIN family toxin of toxin-antitoxin system